MKRGSEDCILIKFCSEINHRVFCNNRYGGPLSFPLNWCFEDIRIESIYQLHVLSDVVRRQLLS